MRSGPGGSRGDRRGGRDGQRGGGRRKRQDSEFDQQIIDIARVTRVMAGGDRKGRVGMGVKKGRDVSQAIQKAVHQAQKNLMVVPMQKGTIPHEVKVKFGAARVFLKPAIEGRGIVAGGPVRSVLELAGLKDVVTKMMGSKNKINNVKATLEALKQLRTREQARSDRGFAPTPPA